MSSELANPSKPLARPAQGRDELNLADFPISVLQHQQPKDGSGAKRDMIVYRATRYNPATRQRLPQKVTLTTSSRLGLPTPADEDVVLALMCVGKRRDSLKSPRVHFTPLELFRIMRWSSNVRSYHRLRDVLRRLKALTITYENAWWDASGHCFEEELATGIIAEYRVACERRGRTKTGEMPAAWVHWTPRFHQSLTAGNIKTLDLERLFSLKLPTSRRMYRFLDKRFHSSPTIELDLIDFACGHIGLTETNNVALIKQRLAPAIRELESLGFIQPADMSVRYRKIRRGVWRIAFEKADARRLPIPRTNPSRSADSPASAIVKTFYRLWQGSEPVSISAHEERQARDVITRYGANRVRNLMPAVVKRLRAQWPAAKTFSAAVKYLPEVVAEVEQSERRTMQARQESIRQQGIDQQAARQANERQDFLALWRPRFDSLPIDEQHKLRETALAQNPILAKMPSVLEDHCLRQLAKQSDDAEPSAN